MDYIICAIIILIIYNYQRNSFIDLVKSERNKYSYHFIDVLFIVHILLYITYTIYIIDNRSDSGEYYEKAKVTYSSNWTYLFETGTNFIVFLEYPLVNFFKLSYESVMLIFSFLGFEGLFFFYLAGRENIFNLPIKYYGFTVLELLFLLPNCHFWSSSLGKGSVMTFAIGIFFYGFSRFQTRIFPLILGAFLIYMVRVHILLAIVLSVGIGSVFSFGKLKWYFKVLIIAVSVFATFYVIDDVLKMSGTESINIIDDNANVNRRAGELGKANSGVDISNYNQAYKLFTFLFRPLFFDAPNFLGIITSFEDVIYLLLAIQIILVGFIQFYKWNGFFIISLITLIIASLALAQVSGNLGIALRQKAQLIPLFFMVYSKVTSLKFNK